MSQDARRAAYLALGRVLTDDAYASLGLDEVFQQMRLSQQDKRLAAAIVYRTLDDLYKIDYALAQFLQDPEGLDRRVRNVLRLSACQLLFMDKVPDFAVVNEAVSLTRSLGMEDLTGLVNGVLRALIRGRETLTWPQEGDLDYLSVTYSIPDWLAGLMMKAYPEEGRKVLSYRNQDHAITIRRNQTLLTQDMFIKLLQKKTWQTSAGRLPEVYKVRNASDIGKDADFLGGRFSIQGEGSMMAVHALEPKAGMTVLDCCAAPGGKTSYIAELMQNTGRVYAWDKHEHRVELIKAQAERLRLYNIRPAVRDAEVHQERFDAGMDRVIIDAPCSGTGVMDNKPDIKYRLQESDIPALATVQQALLHANAPYVKPGGILVYATCSILPQENADQVKRFLADHPEFAIDPLPETVPEKYREQAGEYGLQLLPHRDGVEGFFIARMRRDR